MSEQYAGDLTTRRVLTGVHQTVGNTGALPSVRVTAEREFSQGVYEQDSVVQTIWCSSRARSRELKEVLIFPIREKEENTACRGHCDDCSIWDPAILLRSWNIANISVALSV